MLCLSMALDQPLGGEEGIARRCAALGEICLQQRALAKAATFFGAAARINATLGCAADLAHNCRALAGIAERGGDFQRVATLMRTVSEIERKHRRPQAVAAALSRMAAAELCCGRPAPAAEALEEALGIQRGLPDAVGLADTLGHLGLARMMLDDPATAECRLKEAAALNRAMGRRLHLADNYGNLANLYWSADRKGAAEALYLRALALFTQLGDTARRQKTRLLLHDLQATAGV
jgi:tetratricopeptide (TPR) repeat protein